MGTSALRRRAYYIFGALGLAAGCIAGAAVAGGLPPVVTTSIVPTVSVTVSTPVATATVTTPSVTATVPATVTAPTVTAPAVTAPTVTAPVSVTTTTAAAVTVTTPATSLVPAPVATVTVPKVPTVSAGASGNVSVAKDASVSGRGVAHGSASAAVQGATDANDSAGATVTAAARPTAAAPRTASTGAAPLLSEGPALPAHAGRAAAGGVTAHTSTPSANPPAARNVSGPAPRLDAFLFVPPLVAAQGAAVVHGAVLQTAVVPLATSAREPALTGRTTAVAGGLTALVALAALGLAGAARGSTTLAACAELTRFPFPHFRILGCPDVRAATIPAAAGSGATQHGRAAAPIGAKAARPPRPTSPRLPLPPLPRISDLLGTGFPRSNPWELLKAVVLAMLAAANALLLTVRWRLGRAQGR
jgi:hypothetical protein